MSRQLHKAPLAVASCGTVLLNVAYLDVPQDAAHVVEEALRQRGPVFIGVPVQRKDAARAVESLRQAVREAASTLAGPRLRRPKP